MRNADDEPVTFGLRLTGPELKVTYTALCSLRDDLGHDQADVRQIVQAVIAKLPDEHTMRATPVIEPGADRRAQGAVRRPAESPPA